MDGLGRTKDDIVKAQVAELFQSNNFNDLIQNAYRVKEKLESLGCFKNINIYLDTSNGPDATPEGVEVLISNSNEMYLFFYLTNIMLEFFR